ncbi:hypothetical protein GE061_002733 [Apolygus lucorum]|uniref:Uncharacterized protein n=1 Tax=Apolygus lucorum TaxID=248454 RepID=A0A8S9X5W3_APOLU|nr:hypothetical protein GE061_002733 [Apolygus lucorum]
MGYTMSASLKKETVKSSKNLSKIDKIHPLVVDPVGKYVIKKFAGRPRPQPHRCSSPILPRNQNHASENLDVRRTSTNTVDVINLKVKSPSWVKTARICRDRDAWEETGKVSSIQDVEVITPSSLITCKGSRTTHSRPVKNCMENTVLRYRKHVSEYSFKSPFPIHKLARNSSSDSFVNSLTSFQPTLVCSCTLSAQVSRDPQYLPRVIVKDSANFAKFRRDLQNIESPVLNYDTNSAKTINKARQAEGSLRPPTACRVKSTNSTSNHHELSKFGKIVPVRTTKRPLKSDNSLYSVAIPEEAEGHSKIPEPTQCILNDNYTVKRIIYTLENNLENSSSRNRSPKTRITPGVGG